MTLAAAPSTTQEEQGREHKYDELAQVVHPPRRPDEITGAINLRVFVGSTQLRFAFDVATMKVSRLRLDPGGVEGV